MREKHYYFDKTVRLISLNEQGRGWVDVVAAQHELGLECCTCTARLPSDAARIRTAAMAVTGEPSGLVHGSGSA